MEYWFIIVIVIAALAVGAGAVYVFVNLPTTAQISKLKEWLLYAVTLAEKELGSGTGQIKLRYVYDMFIAKYTLLSKFISFDKFSELVDEVLETFRNMLDSNTSLQAYVEGTSTKESDSE